MSDWPADLPAGFGALCALAFALGLRHGLDADHVATIDSLSRIASGLRARWARWCGTLFSLGHGAVVVAVAGAAALLHGRWQAPAWLDVTGSAISLTFLLTLGIVNLRALFETPPHWPVQPVGVKSRWIGRRLRGAHPLASAAVGALFALSFDTVSQAALFAVAGGAYGVGHALAPALLFVAGMLVTDGLNGCWVARLLKSADRRAVVASRVMCACVAALSLVVGALGVARWFSPRIEAWAGLHGGAFGVTAVAVVALSYALARLLARRPRAPA